MNKSNHGHLWVNINSTGFGNPINACSYCGIIQFDRLRGTPCPTWYKPPEKIDSLENYDQLKKENVKLRESLEFLMLEFCDIVCSNGPCVDACIDATKVLKETIWLKKNKV